MAGLEAEEGDRARCDNARTLGQPGAAIEPARHVDGEDGLAAGVDRGHDLGGRSLQRTRQPGPKQGVDDQITGAADAIAGRRLSQRLRCLAPAHRHRGGIAAKCRGVAEQSQAHAIALLAQDPGGHEAVAAVVARPTGDEDGRRAAEQAHRLGGHRTPGPLHQLEAALAAGDGKAIGLAHLRNA